MSSTNPGDLRIRTKTGDTFIAASQRADGSWRKARRVKDGYIPQEEQPRYETRAQKEQAYRQKHPVGWMPVETEKKTPQIPSSSNAPIAAVSRSNAPITPRDHISKKIGNLNKKLRDIHILENKIEAGELKNPEKTQLEKISRKKKIEDELEKLFVEMERL